MKTKDLTGLAKKASVSRSSLNRLFDNIYPMIYRYFRARIKSDEEAKDMTQNACIKIVNNLKSFDEKKAGFATWMYTMLRNMMTDTYRKKKLDVTDKEPELASSADDPLLSLLKKEERLRLHGALKKLSAREKEIIEMRYFFRMKNKDISENLKISEKTVSSLLSRSLEKIDGFIAENGGQT